MRRAEEIALDIWALARQEISCACPFFALSCTSFDTVVDERAGIFGTDGRVLYFGTERILELFETQGRRMVNRAYMHSLLHCLYLHPLDRRKMDEEEDMLWNLACDIVVEYTVDYLGLPEVLGGASEEKTAVYHRFWKGKSSLTAEEIYESIRGREAASGDIRQLRSLFAVDEHSLWRGLTEMELEERKRQWQQIIARTSQDAGGAGKRAGTQRGNAEEWYSLQQKRRYDYRRFLRRFAVVREEMQMDMETFDYISYCLGLGMYGNMPLVEPLEYTEASRLEEMVIAIDTSSSCSRETVQRFLEETYSILSDRENFFRKMNVHIIQCDCYIQEDVTLCCEEDWKGYMKHIRIQGRGGTDFRPVFRYVEGLIREKKIKNLKGLLYFTDGDGIYPASCPPYETAFVFVGEPKEGLRVPSWAAKLCLDERP